MRYGITGLCWSGAATLLLFVCAPALATGPGRGGTSVVDGATLYRVGQAGNLCAVTFDDGPSRHTGRLLDLLRERGIRATFFMLGKAAERNPELVSRVRDDGHELANHTYSHKSLRHMPYAEQQAEISRVQNVLAALGATSRFVRPPFGRYDANTLKIAEELGLKVALWSVDSHDWQRRASAEGLESVYGRKVLNGIILFHDTHEQTVDAMPGILDALTANQCRFVTVSEFMNYVENPDLLKDLPPQPPLESPTDPALPPVPNQSSGRVSGQTPLEPAAVTAPPAGTGSPEPLQETPQSLAQADMPPSLFEDTFRLLRDWAQGLMGQGS